MLASRGIGGLLKRGSVPERCELLALSLRSDTDRDLHPRFTHPRNSQDVSVLGAESVSDINWLSAGLVPNLEVGSWKWWTRRESNTRDVHLLLTTLHA